MKYVKVNINNLKISWSTPAHVGASKDESREFQIWEQWFTWVLGRGGGGRCNWYKLWWMLEEDTARWLWYSKMKDFQIRLTYWKSTLSISRNHKKLKKKMSCRILTQDLQCQNVLNLSLSSFKYIHLLYKFFLDIISKLVNECDTFEYMHGMSYL